MTTETDAGSTLAHARAYAQRGFAVFPLHSMRTAHRCTCGELFHPKVHRDAAKHPDGAQAPRGHLNATTDPDQIAAWDWTDRNIGICPPEGVTVWDIDPRNDGDRTWKEMTDGRVLPETPIAKTGGGGLHVFFRVPDGMRPRKGPGIDLKTSTGYLVAAPSLHHSGERYAWEVGPEVPIAEAPVFLLEPVQDRLPRDWSKSLDIDSGDYIDAPGRDRECPACGHRGCFSVHRDDPSKWLCWSSNHELDSGGAGREHPDGFWFGDSFDLESHARGVPLRDVFREHRDDTGPDISGLIAKGAPPRTAGADVGGVGGLVASTGGPRGVALLSLSDVLNSPPPEWLVRDLVPARGVVVIAGHPGAGKTFAALDLAMRVARSEPVWMGHRIRRRVPVVYAPLEGHAGIGGRLRAWMVANDADGDTGTLHVLDRWVGPPLLSSKGAAALRHALHELPERPGVVIIDTLAAASGCDENDASEMGRVIAEVQRISTELECVVVLVHHLRKPDRASHRAEPTMHDLRGSSALLGAADQVIGVHVPDRRSTARTLSVLKSKDGPGVPDITFRLDSFGTGLVVDDQEERTAVPVFVPAETREQRAAREAIQVQQETEDLRSQTEVLLERVLAFLGDGRTSNKSGIATSVVGNRAEILRAVDEGVHRGLIAQTGSLSRPLYTLQTVPVPERFLTVPEMQPGTDDQGTEEPNGSGSWEPGGMGGCCAHESGNRSGGTEPDSGAVLRGEVLVPGTVRPESTPPTAGHPVTEAHPDPVLVEPEDDGRPVKPGRAKRRRKAQ